MFLSGQNRPNIKSIYDILHNFFIFMSIYQLRYEKQVMLFAHEKLD